MIMSNDIREKINSELNELWNEIAGGYEDSGSHYYYLEYFKKRADAIDGLVDELIEEKEGPERKYNALRSKVEIDFLKTLSYEDINDALVKMNLKIESLIQENEKLKQRVIDLQGHSDLGAICCE
jgi:predicted DNA-binding ArsR family transcriptional regulator